MTITKAEFIRQMTPGLKLILKTNASGEDGRIRTVVKSTAREIVFRLPAGELSWLVFVKGMEFTKTDDGYTVRDVGYIMRYRLA